MNIQLSINNEQKSYFDIVREKVNYYGEQQVGIAEILALIVGKSAESESCHRLSSLSIREILNLSHLDIQKMGFSKLMAERIHGAILFAKKLNAMSLPEMTTIGSPEDAYNALKYTQHYEQEVFTVLSLDTKNQITGKVEMYRGSLNAAIVHPREVVRP